MALKKGDKAPDFTLVDTDKKEVTLSKVLNKRTILAFYPGAFTGVCTSEMCAMRDNMEVFSGLGAQLIGISVDAPAANKGFATHFNIKYPLLSDYTREVSKKYAGVYEDFGGLKGYTAAKRAVYILDPDGTVIYTWITEEPGKEPDYEEIRKALT